MSEYTVFFKGEVLPGANEQQTRQAIGKLFKAEGGKLDMLFSGKPIAVKKNIDQATAEKFKQLFAKAGALAHIKGPNANNASAPNASQTEQIVAAAPPPAEEAALTTPLSGRTMIQDEGAPQTVVNIQPQSSPDELSLKEQTGNLFDGKPVDNTPPPMAIDADLAPAGSMLSSADTKDNTPPPVAGDWSIT